MKSIQTCLAAGYECLRNGLHFGHRSFKRSYFAAAELLTGQSSPTTITPQADAVKPIIPGLEDEPVACFLTRQLSNRSARHSGMAREFTA